MKTKPFPCSYAGCKFFHDAESGYCSKHRWFGVCMKAFALLSALRQYVELASLVHRAALLNALRQYVELASLVHTLATVRFGWVLQDVLSARSRFVLFQLVCRSACDGAACNDFSGPFVAFALGMHSFSTHQSDERNLHGAGSADRGSLCEEPQDRITHVL